MISGCENICDNCPILVTVEDSLTRLSSIELSEDELDAASEAMVGKLAFVASIDQEAGKIGCKKMLKLIPAAPVPLPQIGHPDRIAYGRHCPAYVSWKERNQ